MPRVDIVILSNGPGEVTTWVRPVLRALRQQLGDDRSQVRISLVLSPCPHASGREVAIAQTYGELDRIQGAEHFYPFLLWGKTAAQWDWCDRGVVVFLGGDQFFPVVIGHRLGYRTVVYGEWETRWHPWIDHFGVMKSALIDAAPPQYAHKLTVVGDLMADVGWEGRRQASGVGSRESEGTRGDRDNGDEVIGLLPGSKPLKLTQGVPLMLAIAERIQAVRPHTRFVVPVAPTLDLATLAQYADPQRNPVARYFDNVGATLQSLDSLPVLETANGVHIELHTAFPAHDLLAQCRLCLTTVGANTAELGSLAVPMVVLLPTQHLEMRAWNGIGGVLANLPGIGATLSRLMTWWFLRKSRLLAWPNIWAGEKIVPELVGHVEPAQAAAIALDLLNHPEHLEDMRQRLRQVRGNPGAAGKLAEIICKEINNIG